MLQAININTASLNARDNQNVPRNMLEVNSECLASGFCINYVRACSMTNDF